MAVRTDVKIIVTAVTGSASKALNSLGKDLNNMGVKTRDAKIAAIGISAAITAAGVAFVAFATDTAFASSRVGELELALRAMSKATGISEDAIFGTVQGLRDLNIAHRQALESVGLMITAEIDLSKATDLARTAQDLAVVAGLDSSDAFKTLTRAIAVQRPLLLRQFGITKGLDQIYKEWAKDTGFVTKKTKGLSVELTDAQKKAAFMHVILKQGEKVVGVYEGAMEAVSKRYRSLTGRIIPDFKVAVGGAFEQALMEIVDTISSSLEEMTEKIKSGEISFEGLGAVLGTATKLLSTLFKAALKVLEAFLSLSPQVQTATAIFLALIPVLTGIVLTLSTMQAGLALVGLTFTAVAAPVLAVAAAVGVLILIWPKLKGSWEESINFWKDTLIPGFLDGIGILKENFEELNRSSSESLSGVLSKAQEVGSGVFKALVPDFGETALQAAAILAWLKDTWGIIWDQISDTLKEKLFGIDHDLFSWSSGLGLIIQDGVELAMKNMESEFKDGFRASVVEATSFGNNMLRAMVAMFSLMSFVMAVGSGSVLVIFQGFLGGLLFAALNSQKELSKATSEILGPALQKTFQSGGELLSAIWEGSWDNIKSIASEFSDDLIALFIAFGETTKRNFGVLWASMLRSTKFWFGEIFIFLDNWFGILLPFWDTNFEGMFNSFVVWLEGLVSQITTKGGELLSVIMTLVGNISTAFLGIVSNAWNWGSDLITNFIDGIRSKIRGLSEGIRGFVVGQLGVPGELLRETGGTVPGPVGAAVPITAHAGEVVIPAGVPSGLGGGGGGVVLNVNIGVFAGAETEKRRIAEELYAALLDRALTQNKTVAELMGG